MQKQQVPHVYGFTLVELSIVLIVLGLVAGGVVAGRSLIRAAELRAAISEYDNYRAVTYIFEQKYSALPGDMTNATSFWGRADNGTFSGQCASPNDDVDESNLTLTCNGNGDGNIDDSDDQSAPPDWFRYWQHLRNAGLIAGNYRGVPASGVEVGYPDTEYGASKVPNAGWAVFYNNCCNGNYTGFPDRFNGYYGNFMMLGESIPNSWVGGPLFSPQESWQIDKKFDDALPGRGKVVVLNINACTFATNPTQLDVEYRLSTETNLCSVLFREQF